MNRQELLSSAVPTGLNCFYALFPINKLLGYCHGVPDGTAKSAL
ncbi:MAG TPA: hypothetical protein VM095_08290 [Pyrinomonadaceae bacterium]|nr:hypothetical protein [Pyrinomonadaceae bacterium]